MIEESERPWDVARRISATYKARQIEEAVELGRHAVSLWPNDVNVLRATAWSLYHRDVVPLKNDPKPARFAQAEKSVREIASWTMSPDDGPFDTWDPKPFIVLKLARAQLNEGRSALARAFLGMLPPERLPTTSGNVDFDPLRTEWFNLMTAALKELGEWQALADIGEVPERIGLLGKSVQWIEYRLVIACLELGQFDQALTGLDRALPGKRDPWVRILRARIFVEVGRKEEAEHWLRSALADTRDADLGLTINGVELLGRLLREKDPERAAAHGRLMIQIRETNGWPVKRPDLELARTAGDDPRPGTPDELKALRAWWQASETSQRRTGTIARLLPSGTAGFLTTDEGQQYYFLLPRSAEPNTFPPDTRVSFVLIDGFDKKKGVASKQAVKLRKTE